MPTFSAGGIMSGIDTNQLIADLVDLERSQRITPLENRKTTAKTQSSKFQEINTKLLAINTAAKKLYSSDEFFMNKTTVYDGTTNNDAYLVASSSGSAKAGTYNVTVTRLAQEAIYRSASGKDSDTTLFNGSGTLTINFADSSSISVAVDNTTTLSDLQDLINDDSENDDKVSATVIDDGSDSNNNFMTIRGLDTGDDNDITSIALADTTYASDPTWTSQQDGQDSQVSVDGIGTIERATNTLTDVISGVTLELRQASGATEVEVTVSTDLDGIKENINGFVEAYNGFVLFMKDLTRYSAEEEERGVLAGDATVRNILDLVRTAMTDEVSGLDRTTDYNSLAVLGIKTQEDGTLSIDDTDLTDALKADSTAVSKVFIDDGTTQGIADLIRDYTDPYKDASDKGGTGKSITQTDGIIDNKIDSYSDQIENFNDRILFEENRLEKYEAQLLQQYTNLEVIIAGFNSMSSFLSGMTTSGNFK